jgi:hypothetical protein
MPHDIDVRLYFASDARRLVEKYLSEVNVASDKSSACEILDFNKIVPMPKELDVALKSIDPLTEEGQVLQKKYDDNLANFGFQSWYDWSLKNWGTKWNSYSVVFHANQIRMNTAWHPPGPVIQELARLIHEDIRMTYVDEAYEFWGEAFFYGNGKPPQNHLYSDPAQTPPKLFEELDISEAVAFTRTSSDRNCDK